MGSVVLLGAAVLTAPLMASAQDVGTAGAGDPSDSAHLLAETAASFPHEIQLTQRAYSPRIAPIIELEFSQLAASQTRAWTLLGIGTMSMAVGGGFALPWVVARTPGDETMAAAGIMTASWGLINTVLSVPWLLNFYSEERRIQRWATAGNADIDLRLRTQIDRARSDATFFAFMTGLDIAYVTAGAFLWWIGDNAATANTVASGFGKAIVLQGSIGFLFDGWNWIARSRNADQLSGLRQSE